MRFVVFQNKSEVTREIASGRGVQSAGCGGSEGTFRVDQSGSDLWDDMLEEFRALGGTAENICLKNGRFGRGLFPVDPAKPISVRIPDSLLVEPKHVSVENGAFRLDAHAPVGAREKSFLENYQRDFSWGVTYHETEGLLQMFHAAPAELRELLRKPFNFDRWLAGPTVDAVLIESVDARQHLEQAKIVIAAGKPMFIDKPVASTLEDARMIVAIC